MFMTAAREGEIGGILLFYTEYTDSRDVWVSWGMGALAHSGPTLAGGGGGGGPAGGGSESAER